MRTDFTILASVAEGGSDQILTDVSERHCIDPRLRCDLLRANCPKAIRE